MRTLLLMRGAPGAGKSTWIKNHSLEKYTLCPDELRIMCNSLTYNVDGDLVIPRNRFTEKKAWDILFSILEYRMSRGEFTIIDATCSKTKDMTQYRDLADKYRYKIYCVDFTGVSLDICKMQNKQRPSYKWVPDKDIENIYARFATQQIPSGITVIKPSEFEKVLESPIDLSDYKKLVFIGDIHGCFDTLMQYPDFKNGLKADTEYIFCGDYVDRGNQNDKVMHWLNSIMNKSNVCLLEGNHEKWLRAYGNSEEIGSKEFFEKTRPQLLQNNYTPKMARMFYRKLRQMSHISYNGIEILACHGGIPSLNRNLSSIATENFINGIGEYKDADTIAETWMRATEENQYLIHGHRNIYESPTQVADRVFNLEGKVEFGGDLRIVEVNQDLIWTVTELHDCQPVDENLETGDRPVDTVEDAISYLKNNKYIQEKTLDSDISSFNFSRDAFYERNWNKQTILARGLFIDKTLKTIMARSYEKFFRIDELPETTLTALSGTLKFPIKAFVKENGFLGIVSYDYRNDCLFVASKSTNTGDFVGYLNAQLIPYKERLLDYLRTQYKAGNPVTAVFECIDPVNDPHIIEHNDGKLVLLDIIKNTINYHLYDAPNYYEYLKETAEFIGCPVKELAYTFTTWKDFANFYEKVSSEDYKYKGNYIEGFVFEDNNGFMTKCKSGYYNLWKKLRGVSNQTLRCGYYLNTGSLTSEVENLFYGFCRDLYTSTGCTGRATTEDYKIKTDIISLRKLFKNTIKL